MKKNSFWNDFKTFMTKGNVINLAVGVIIGAAFGKITSSLVSDIIMPPIGLLIGGVNFTDLKIILKPEQIVSETEKIAEVAIRYGALIQVIIEFAIIGLSLFLIVRIASKLSTLDMKKLFKKNQADLSQTTANPVASAAPAVPVAPVIAPAVSNMEKTEQLLADIKLLLASSSEQKNKLD